MSFRLPKMNKKENSMSFYTKSGFNTFGSDGSVFTQTGSFSSDGSTRIGSTATGIGSVFNDKNEWE